MEGSAGARYLRLLVEAVLADRHGARPAGGGDGPVPDRLRPDGPGSDRVRHAGAALVAVGAADPRLVDRLDADLALALELRRVHPDRTRLAVVGPPDPRDLQSAGAGPTAGGETTGPGPPGGAGRRERAQPVRGARRAPHR